MTAVCSKTTHSGRKQSPKLGEEQKPPNLPMRRDAKSVNYRKKPDAFHKLIYSFSLHFFYKLKTVSNSLKNIVPPYLHSICISLKGDALVTSCYYDTRGYNSTTLGGFAISDEMCVNYIHYYPATELEVCKSSISENSLYEYFLYMKK